MLESSSNANKSGIVPRLNPLMLRRARAYFVSESDSVESIRLERTIPRRKSIRECDAEYNPLGKFGASFSRV